MKRLRLHSLVPGAWQQERGRWLLSIGVIALGVALVTAIHTLNHSALTELDHAARQLGGQADLRIEAGRAGFSDEWFAPVARTPGVAAASPVLEIEVTVVREGAREGSGTRAPVLRIAGIDALRAGQVQPGLVPQATGSDRFAALNPENLFLNDAALRKLGLSLQAGTAAPVVELALPGASGAGQRFVVAGRLADDGAAAPLGVIDLAAAQDRLGHAGRLSRIDVRRSPEADEASLRARLKAALPPTLMLATPAQGQTRTEALSRSYRANLTVLALVALFTGGFMVFSVSALSVVKRRSEFALLRVLGMTRQELLRGLVREGLMAGFWGSLLGLGGGLLIARGLLRLMASDLGAGFFAGLPPVFHLDPGALLGIGLTGLAAGALGAWLPALEAARRAPARALREGDEAALMQALPDPRIGAGLLVSSVALLLVPPVGGLPLGGYLAIACVLFGTLALLPRALQGLAGRIRSPRPLLAQLAWQQFAGMPGYAASGLATVVVSFSLVSAMAIMVHSFRTSVDHWLGQVLAADVYLRATGGLQGRLPEGLAQRLCGQPGLSRCERLRYESLLLDPEKPPLTLIARTTDRTTLAALSLPDSPAGTAPGRPVVWVSEAAVALHGFPPEGPYSLPLAHGLSPVWVAGVWRDYSRTWGALVMSLEDYQRLTGDETINDLAFSLAEPAAARDFARALREDPEAGKQDIAERTDIRRLSLALFDRTFAVTYALELAALLVGLVGIAAHFAALTLTRRREFGMLRHLGFTQRQLGRMLMLEGAVNGLAGAAVGLLLGLGISLVLIHVVNRQSFHWGMELTLPWPALATLSLVLVALAALAARLAGHAAMMHPPALAVRETA